MRFRPAVFALLLVISMSATLPVRAAGPDVRQVRGGTAEASFSSAFDCGYLSLDVAVIDHAVKTEPGAPADEGVVLVNVVEYDHCLFITKEYFGSAPLQAREYVQTSLNAASLEKAVSVCDNQGACRDFAIDLDWTGYGETSGSRYVNRQDNGESRFIQRWAGSYRRAHVSGSASDGAFDYATGDSEGSLFQLNMGQVNVSRYATTELSAARAQSYILQTRGNLGEAVLYVPTACGYRQLNISVADVATRYGSGAPEPEKLLGVYGSDYDGCEGTANVYQGSTVLSEGEYRQDGLDEATLAKTIEVCDASRCWNLALDLAWIGEGEVMSGSYISRQDIESFMYISRWRGSNRNARVVGSATDGGFDYASGEAWGTLHQVQSGSITINR